MTFEEFKDKYQKITVQEVSSSPPMNPVVSVLVQTYQQKEFIRECLESILMQETDFEFEILIGEDGSLDGTRAICLEYAEKHPKKIRLFLHHRDNQIQVMGEPSSNFNAFYNFYSARGKYIAFCEGDDKWGDPLKLQKQVNFLKANNQFAFSYHEFMTIDENGEEYIEILEEEQPRLDISRKELLHGKYHPLLLTICFKKDHLDIPREIFQVLNVDTFLLVLFGDAGDAKFHNDILPSFYRFRRNGMWSKRKRNKKLLSKIVTYRNLATYFERSKQETLKAYFIRKMKQNFKMLLVSHIRNKNFYLAGNTLLEFLKR